MLASLGIDLPSAILLGLALALALSFEFVNGFHDTANAIQGTVSVGSSAYDNAELFLTYNGALVAAAPLTSYLTSSQSTLSLSSIAPGGSADTTYAPGVYYAEIWAWNSTNPTGTLTRIPYASPIDMSAGNATGVTLSIN